MKTKYILYVILNNVSEEFKVKKIIKFRRTMAQEWLNRLAIPLWIKNKRVLNIDVCQSIEDFANKKFKKKPKFN